MKTIIIFVVLCFAVQTLASCGDGVVEPPGEDCEVNQLGSATCVSLGFPFGGILDCNPGNCKYDTSRCAVCGDGRVMGTEVCDGTNVNGNICASVGYPYGGVLVCRPDCLSYDASGCFWCGNGVADGNEECDGTDFRLQTCSTFLNKYLPTGVLKCGPGCRYDVSDCGVPKVNYPNGVTPIKMVLGIRVNATNFFSDTAVKVKFDDGVGHSRTIDPVQIGYLSGNLFATFQINLTPSNAWKVTVTGKQSGKTAVSPNFVVTMS